MKEGGSRGKDGDRTYNKQAERPEGKPNSWDEAEKGQL